MLIRLLPMILANLLFAAHILRFHGIWFASLIILLVFTLFIRKPWISFLWQLLLLLATLEWIRVTVIFVRNRMTLDQPYIRLVIIMGVIILFFVFVIFWWNNKNIKQFYHPDT